MSHSESNCYIQAFSFNEDFLMTPNSLWENENLSFRAKGLLGYMLSRPKNWKVHTWQLSQLYKGVERGNGIEGVRSMIKELIDHGYVIYNKFRNEEGQWEHRYMVYPLPFKDFQKMFPERVKPNLVEPVLVKPSILTRTELTRTELKQQQQPIKEHKIPPLNNVVVSSKNYSKKEQPNKIVFHECLENVEALTELDKLALYKFPEERVKLALKFAKAVPFKNTLIAQLVWHCSQEKPPKAAASFDLYSKCLEMIGKVSSETSTFEVNTESITFIHTVGQSLPKVIKYSDKNAGDLIKDEFIKRKFKPKKQIVI